LAMVPPLGILRLVSVGAVGVVTGFPPRLCPPPLTSSTPLYRRHAAPIETLRGPLWLTIPGPQIGPGLLRPLLLRCSFWFFLFFLNDRLGHLFPFPLSNPVSNRWIRIVSWPFPFFLDRFGLVAQVPGLVCKFSTLFALIGPAFFSHTANRFLKFSVPIFLLERFFLQTHDRLQTPTAACLAPCPPPPLFFSVRFTYPVGAPAPSPPRLTGDTFFFPPHSFFPFFFPYFSSSPV